MNSSFLILLVSALLILALVATWARGFRRQPPFARFAASFVIMSERLRCLAGRGSPYALANLAEGEHLSGKISYTADNAFAVRFLLAKRGTVDANIDVCGAADQPSGVCTDAPAAGELASIDILGAAPGTHRVVLGGAVTQLGQALYTAAGGKVTVEPTVAGTYWLIGYALMTGVLNDVIEFSAIPPIKVIVIAALTQTSGTTIAGLNSTAVNPTKADFDALLAETGKLQADFYALRAALAHPALVKGL